MCMSSHTEMYIDSTVGGILQVDTRTDILDSDSEDGVGGDSEIDENLEICELEKRDFDDEDEIW